MSRPHVSSRLDRRENFSSRRRASPHCTGTESGQAPVYEPHRRRGGLDWSGPILAGRTAPPGLQPKPSQSPTPTAGRRLVPGGCRIAPPAPDGEVVLAPIAGGRGDGRDNTYTYSVPAPVSAILWIHRHSMIGDDGCKLSMPDIMSEICRKANWPGAVWS